MIDCLLNLLNDNWGIMQIIICAACCAALKEPCVLFCICYPDTKSFDQNELTTQNYFLIPKRTKRTKMIACSRCGSNDIAVYAKARSSVIYTVYICLLCGCGFSAS